MRKALLAGLCSLGLLLGAQPGRAEPSLWERTLNPKSKRGAALVRSLGRMLDDASEAADDAETLRNFRLAAIAMAELSGAPALEQPEVLWLYGHLLLDADLGREAEVEALAEKLLERTSLRARWLEDKATQLAARAARRDARRAVPVITRALSITWDAHLRSSLLRERADARMALGDLRGSVNDQRRALEAAERATDRALARYGLGLALERSADLPAAFSELRFADALQARLDASELSCLEVQDAFVFRPFDRHYVFALTAMALADQQRDPASVLLELERALAEWERFELAAPADDPWLTRARSYRRAVELQRERAFEQSSEAERSPR